MSALAFCDKASLHTLTFYNRSLHMSSLSLRSTNSYHFIIWITHTCHISSKNTNKLNFNEYFFQKHAPCCLFTHWDSTALRLPLLLRPSLHLFVLLRYCQCHSCRSCALLHMSLHIVFWVFLPKHSISHHFQQSNTTIRSQIEYLLFNKRNALLILGICIYFCHFSD